VTGIAAGATARTGIGRLLRLSLRLDRVRLAVWVLAVGGLTVYAATALRVVYPTAADRQARARLIGAPAGVLLSGPGYGTGHYTLGAMIANELTLSVMVAVSIMSIQLVVRRTRAEEEDGRAELLLAGAVFRLAPLGAALAEAVLANAAVALVVAAGLAGSGLAGADAEALAVGIGLVGLVFGAIAALAAQLTERARAASGTALAVLAAAVGIRGVGDLLHRHGSALSWFSPLAWAQQTRAFVDLRWWPLLLLVAAVVALVVAVRWSAAGRDLGAGLIAARPGPAHASHRLSGPTALAARLQRGTVLAWGIALLALGAVYGSFADQVAGIFKEDSVLSGAFAAAGRNPADAYFASIALFQALAAAGFVIASVLRMRGEEDAGRVELVLAAAVDRRRLFAAQLVVAGCGAALLVVASGLGTGLAAAVVRGEPSLVGRSLGAQLVHLPAVLVAGAAAAALVGLAPRLAALGWVVLGWAVVAGLFGPLLQLPGWAGRLSPFGWDPAFPAEPVSAARLLGLCAVAVALAAVALAGFRRRDVPA
jgi:ABC-2 type transport system permease protein